jgi:hypothetical protein
VSRADVGAFLVYRLYPVFETQTETANKAFGAFLTCVVTIGGIDPAIHLGGFLAAWIDATYPIRRTPHLMIRYFANYPLTGGDTQPISTIA